MEESIAQQMGIHVGFSLLSLREGMEMIDDAVLNAGNAMEATNKINALARFMRLELDDCLQKCEAFMAADSAISKASDPK
jgi:hypothetical protein